jgi:hypothetical protein
MKTMGIAAAALAGAVVTPAFAQTSTPPVTGTTPPGLADEVRDVMRARVPAPSRAFEIGVDAGYTQGFGSVYSGRGVGEVAGAGGTLGLSLGYRFNPRWSMAVTGQYQGYASGIAMPSGGSVRGALAGVQTTVHVEPYDRVDPFVTVGAGYRALIESPPGSAPASVTHGLELGRIEVGLDVRPNESVAIAPVLGADLNMFMWRSGGGTETAPFTSRTFSAFVFAGVNGRFDLGGARQSQPATRVGSR